MAELPELPEIHEIHHHAHGDRFGRGIAIITVLATLCAAWTAVLQANAIRQHDQAAAKAQELSSETLGERSRSEGAARVQLERFELAEKQRARAALARQELLFATGARARELRIQERRVGGHRQADRRPVRGDRPRRPRRGAQARQQVRPGRGHGLPARLSRPEPRTSPTSSRPSAPGRTARPRGPRTSTRSSRSRSRCWRSRSSCSGTR